MEALAVGSRASEQRARKEAGAQVGGTEDAEHGRFGGPCWCPHLEQDVKLRISRGWW